MKNKSEIIQKIEPHYVGEDCIQEMVPYKRTLTLLNKDDILYHCSENPSFYINKYLMDERRKQFPYSNIPTYKSKVGFEEYNYTNQLFNFDEPYIRIVDGNIIESFAVRVRKEALLFKKVLPTFKRTVYKTREELEKMFEKTDEECLYVIDLDGSFCQNNLSSFLPNEEQIVEDTKKRIAKGIENYVKILSQPEFLSVNLSDPYPYFSEYSLKFFQPELDEMSSTNIFLIKINGIDIHIEKMLISFIKINCYKVDIFDIPVTKYTLEQIKTWFSKMVKTKEPKVSLKLNPDISKEELKKQKQLIKSLRKTY